MQALTTRKTLAMLLLITAGIPFSAAFSDNSTESQWLFSLKHAHLDNGSSLPINQTGDDDTLRISSRDIRKLISPNSARPTQHYSRLQFSPLNYQAEISEKEVSVRLYYQF